MPIINGTRNYYIESWTRQLRRTDVIVDYHVNKGLSDTVEHALKQVERKNYEALLIEKGIPRECIRKYGFAFCGKRVLIGEKDRI